MKRLTSVLILTFLVAITYFEWVAYKRAHIPGIFTYQAADSLDLAYHDAELVATYYETVADLERYGRYCWKEYKLDVRADRPLASPEQELAAAYQQKLAWVKQMEAKLKQSYKLKEQGVAAAEIELMLEEGLSQIEAKAQLLIGTQHILQLDDQGESVFRVQELLSRKGYEIPVDGYFERKTLNAVLAFQKSVGLYPTGKVSDLTIKKMLE